MTSTAARTGRLPAVSDPPIGYDDNRALWEVMRPGSGDDWLRRVLPRQDTQETAR